MNVFKKLLALILILVSTFVAIGQHKNLQIKEVFENRFPKQFIFRGEYNVKVNATDESFSRAAEYSCGIIQKYVPYDEMKKLDPYKTAAFASRYVRENPTKLILLHWDAEEHVNCIEGSSTRFFPGHWITFEGTKPATPIGKKDTWITVEDIRPLSVTTKNPKARSRFLNPVLLAVRLDKNGLPIWYESEYLLLEEIDKETNKIKVKRSHALSKSISFDLNTRIAPISTYLSSDHLFVYNYSVNSPKDKNGKQAIDIQFEELTELFDPNKGRLRDLNGIAFDVLNWGVPFNPALADTDGDGIGDGGIDSITGEDLFRKGAYLFQQRLRNHFGNEFILTNDGYNEKDQRAIGIFNGLESEGLVRHNDAFRGFSKTLNVFAYWMKNNPIDYKLAYIVPKIMNPVDQSKTDQYVRFCTATVTCLGASLAAIPTEKPEERLAIDEIICGNQKKMYWLGKPIGEMQNLGFAGRDVLDNNGIILNKEYVEKIKAENCTFLIHNNEILVSGIDKKSFQNNCRITLPKIKIPEHVNDITLCLEAKAIEPLKGMNKEIPRMMFVQISGLPDYEKTEMLNKMYNSMWGLVGDSYFESTFCYRKVGGRELEISIEMEGQGDFAIKNIRIMDQTSAIIREFENGIVLANPSLSDYKFDLSPYSSSKFRRIEGKEYPNNGDLVDSTNGVVLGPCEGLFLVKIKN